MYVDKCGWINECLNKWLHGGGRAQKSPRKSTNMVPVSSIEIRGLGVLCVFEAKLCDCADEQTEANERYTAHRNLGWQPVVH